MGVETKEIARRELIGINVEITDSKNKANIGVKGRIVDETKNTLVIEEKGAKKRVFKNNIVLKLKFDKKTVEVKGELFSGRPKERIK